MSEPILSVRGLEASYGRVQILFGLDLDVHEGEIVALLGTNGAGKSTLLKAVTGLLPPHGGTVHFDGDDLTSLRPDEIARRGIVMMPGGRSVFPTLTVRENLTLACWTRRKDRAGSDAAVERVLGLFPRLVERIDQPAGNLSGGEQQMLAVAQAMIPDPKLLMIDELSLGLAPAIVGQLIEVVRGLHATGVTIIVVEQSINVALTLADRAVFMEKGEFRFSGPTRELLDRPDVLRSVFIEGGRLDDEQPEPPAARVLSGPADGEERTPPAGDAPVVFETVDLQKRFGGIVAVDGVDLQLRQGQILGLIGQNGAGKTTLFDCATGLLPTDGGQVLLHGEDITHLPPHLRAARGLGRSFQEARLFPSLTTLETISLASERHLASRSMLGSLVAQPASRDADAAAREAADRLIELLGLGAYREKLTAELSTGTRRIVELACLLAADPSVIVLDEPSGGIAQRETEALGPLLLRIQAISGASILVIEHDMPLLSSICDELVALELGAVIARGTPNDVLADERVVRSYLGSNETAINRSGSAAAAAG